MSNQKSILSIKFIICVSKNAQKLNLKVNPIKFADIHRSYRCINVRSIKVKLDAVVSGSWFELMLSIN